IIVNHRQELRLAVPPFPAEIRAKAFLRTKVLEAFIYDISRKGVRVATEVGLETEKQCRLATSLMVKKSYRPFEALCSVRYCLPERNRYFSGLRFDQVGLEARKVLEKFLTEVRAETSLF
ncbi:MAG TPA: PilZ domain-containing protein, partial [bacterium]|nr:PilZ domain-containing protein [bacterium]